MVVKFSAIVTVTLKISQGEENVHYQQLLSYHTLDLLDLLYYVYQLCIRD